MNIHKWQFGFFMALVAAGLVLSYLTLSPYLGVLFLAIIIAVIFYPLHLKVVKLCKGHNWIGSFVSVLGVIVVVLLPLALFGFLVFQESTDLYAHIRSGASSEGVVATMTEQIRAAVSMYAPPGIDIAQNIDLNTFMNQFVGWLANNTGALIGGVFEGLIGVFILVLGLFYAFKDGRKLTDRIVEISPLKDTDDRDILSTMRLAINSVIRGHLIIGLIQGVLTGVGFWIFGVPSPAIWGVVAAIASLIPTLGTGLVIIPAVIFLFITAGFGPAIGLVLWGVIVVGLVDNIIGPKLIERGIKIHPFLILMFVLGGLHLFGPIGFIAGPVLLSLLVALLHIYPTMIEQEKS